MRDNPWVQATWDDALDAWVADASAPGSGADQGTGPAGPAGVCVLRSGGATLSQCTMTGRVTSLWYEDGPTDADRALLGLVLDDASSGALDAPAAAPPFVVGIRPVGVRLGAARLAILSHARQHVPMAQDGAAAFLLQAELAATLTQLRGTDPAFVNDADLAQSLDAADELAEAVGSGSLRDRLPDGVRFDPHRVQALLDSIAGELGDPSAPERPAAALLSETAHQLREQPVVMGGPMFRGAAHQVDHQQPVAHPELFDRHRLTIITNDGEPDTGRIALRATVRADGTFALGDLAPRQVGLQPQGGMIQVDGAWCTVTQPMHGAARHPLSWWATALHEGRPVGSAPFTLIGDDAIARFALTGAPDEVLISGHPLRPQVTTRIADLEAADRLSRAAWWAHRRHDSTARQWFAHSAVAWLELGRIFRAGWAWQLADEQLASELLARRAKGDELEQAIAALRSVARSGDVPGPDLLAAVPTPAWVHATDLGAYASAADDEQRRGGAGT